MWFERDGTPHTGPVRVLNATTAYWEYPWRGKMRLVKLYTADKLALLNIRADERKASTLPKDVQ